MSNELICDVKPAPNTGSPSGFLAKKPTTGPGVVDAVGIESAVSAPGLYVPVCATERSLPGDDMKATREGGNDAAMARYAAGDDAAFVELYDGLAPLLIAYLRRRVLDRTWVEDLLQETFLRMHQHRARYRRDAPVLPWAITIAARLLANRVRGVRRANVVFVDGDNIGEGVTEIASPEQLAMVMELAEQIEKEIGRLPDVDREAFELVKRKELPLKDAAPRLGMTILALKMRLFRVYNRLRRHTRGGA